MKFKIFCNLKVVNIFVRVLGTHAQQCFCQISVICKR